MNNIIKNQQGEAELHLIILWHNARYKEKDILEDIQKNLSIIECYEITWNKNNVANNFTRFYGEKLNNGSFKEKECGTGSFLLVSVIDNSPKYDFVETSRGFECVNVNIFNLKIKYREWTGGGHKIHTTNTTQETNHDITLLLGINYDDYLSTHKEIWNGNIKYINRDLTGANGWNSLEELFYTLNSTVNYVVLRNYENLPNLYMSDKHGDIDILTDDYNNLCFILNATPVYDLSYRVHNYTIVNKQQIFFDFRFLGDDYYCYDFEKDILSSKILNSNNLFIPNDKYIFYSLIYHALIHKRIIAADYYDKIFNLFCNLYDSNNKNSILFKRPFDLYYDMLLDFMKANSYYFVKPEDSSVFYNEKVIDLQKNIKYIEHKYKIENVKPYLVNQYNGGGSGYVYYTGNLKNGKRVFIKYGGIGESAKNEFKSLKTLYNINPNNFLKAYYYENDKHKLIITDFIDGINLLDYINSNYLNEENKTNFLKQLENIAKTLIEAKIMHRDIRPGNILVTKDLKLIVIDPQFAVNFNPYSELDFVLNNKSLVSNLGEDYAMDYYTWDDMYSLDKICTLINCKSDFIHNKIGKYTLKLDYKDNTTIIQKIFSVKNKYVAGHKYKIIYILCFKITKRCKYSK